MTTVPAAAMTLSARLAELTWVSDLLVAGSLATGDYIPAVSDLDLVALVGGPVDVARQAALVDIHRNLDLGVGAGVNLGCVYIEESRLSDAAARHTTWTYGRLVSRIVSGIIRARWPAAATRSEPGAS